MSFVYRHFYLIYGQFYIEPGAFCILDKQCYWLIGQLNILSGWIYILGRQFNRWTLLHITWTVLHTRWAILLLTLIDLPLVTTDLPVTSSIFLLSSMFTQISSCHLFPLSFHEYKNFLYAHFCSFHFYPEVQRYLTIFLHFDNNHTCAAMFCQTRIFYMQKNIWLMRY